MTSVAKTGVTVDNSDLVATDVRNAADVTKATNSNLDNIRQGYSSISANDTHVKHLEDALVAGSSITLTKNDAGADETLTINADTLSTPNIERVDNDTLVVGVGGSDTQTLLDLATAGNWIGGSSLESNSEWVHVYEVVASPGTYKLYDKHPIYPAADTDSLVFDAQVNQAGWDGSDAAHGLNASTVVYDNDTGEGNIEVGMYLLVYDDASFTQGRGKGASAAASVNDLSVARITAIDTGTNTITLDTNGLGHQIAINDDDYIIAIEAGTPLYQYVGSAWYRWIGALWNDSSGNLVAANNQYGHNRMHNFHSYTVDEGADWTETSTSFVDIDATDMNVTLIASGKRPVSVGYDGNVLNSTVAKTTHFDVELNGTRIGGEDGIVAVSTSTSNYLMNGAFRHTLRGLLPGTHNFVMQWKVNGGTAKIYNGNTATVEMHQQFMVQED